MLDLPHENETEFQRLLFWLDSDIEIASHKYENLRARLTVIFRCRGVHTPEELADITFERVSAKLESLQNSYVGNPENYFYGVARNVLREHLRKPQGIELTFDVKAYSDEIDSDEDRMHCLDTCLSTLSGEDKRLILQYFSYPDGGKADARRTLADETGSTIPALRTRVHRIKAVLEKCVRGCIAK